MLEKGNLAEAEKSLRKAIDQYPKFAEAWLRLGDLEQRRKNIEGAMADYQEAINADPNFAVPYIRMAFLSAVDLQLGTNTQTDRTADFARSRKLSAGLLLQRGG